MIIDSNVETEPNRRNVARECPQDNYQGGFAARMFHVQLIRCWTTLWTHELSVPVMFKIVSVLNSKSVIFLVMLYTSVKLRTTLIYDAMRPLPNFMIKET